MTISKKAPLMAFVLGLGLMVSMSSFVKSSLNSGRLSKTYYHVGNSFLDTNPGANYSCQVDNDYSCTIVFSGSAVPSVPSFAEGSTPAGSWTATPVNANQSWKLIP